MSLKQRLKKVEKRAGNDAEPTVVIFRTLYEGKDGETEGESTRATIIWGQGCSANVERREDESFEEFSTRLDGYQKLTWQQAQRTEGLSMVQVKAAETKSGKAEQ